MASKTFASIIFRCFTFIVLNSFQKYLISAHPLNDGHSVSPFSFVEHLQGHHLGEHINGLNDLKKYLKKFGYLSYNGAHVDDNVFDVSLPSAIRKYQLNFDLEPTGTLDSHTVSKMIKPRCGVPDIVNNTTRMQSSIKGHIHTKSHYSFFQGKPIWPDSKHDLTYAFKSNTPLQHRLPIINALQTWASASQLKFKFTEIQNFESADIRIEFYAREHEVFNPFDGPNGELAHAFAPTNGALHFDADEKWTLGGVDKSGFDIQTVALHELGHILGLDHSSVKEAIMYPSVEPSQIKGLHDDDIQGLKALYNM